jgi:hypothetical protein
MYEFETDETQCSKAVGSHDFSATRNFEIAAFDILKPVCPFHLAS